MRIATIAPTAPAAGSAGPDAGGWSPGPGAVWTPGGGPADGWPAGPSGRAGPTAGEAAAGHGRAWGTWAGYLVAVTAAEIATAYGDPRLGLGLHLLLIFLLPIHATFAPTDRQPLLLALLFAPLTRVVSLTLPLAGLPLEHWWLLTSLPLFAAVVPAIRILGLTRPELGLRPGRLPLQLAIALLGVPFGAIEFALLHPAPILPRPDWPALLPAVAVLIVSTGFLEELIFRGVLQAAAGRLLGGRGLVYVTAIFAVLHIGYLSPIDVAFVFAIGLVFAGLVARTGSLLGVTLAHGLTNIGLFIVFPLLAIPAPAGPVAPPALEAVREPADELAGPPIAIPAGPGPGARPLDTGPTAADPLTATPPALAGVERALEPPARAHLPTARRPIPTVERWVVYVVQPGDTLYGLARRSGVPIDLLRAVNRIEDVDRILAGQVLRLPPR